MPKLKAYEIVVLFLLQTSFITTFAIGISEKPHNPISKFWNETSGTEFGLNG